MNNDTEQDKINCFNVISQDPEPEEEDEKDKKKDKDKKVKL